MLHPRIKSLLGYDAAAEDTAILAEWKKRTRRICKPCWELKYCPYGPLVEQFPLPPMLKADVKSHYEHAKRCLRAGALPDGTKLDQKRKAYFEDEVRIFRPRDHPDEIPQVVVDASCRVFGHMCPVFYVAEPLTETKDRRAHSRSIPRDVMLKVVRRDGQICQQCHEPVPDDQVEFDHIIPFSKGGRSSTENLRLVCRACNREKSDSLEDLLSPDPIMHLVELRNQKKKEPNQSPEPTPGLRPGAAHL
jgi:hypothetical protein